MVDLCLHCDIPERDYDPSDPDYFTCSDCDCYRCEYVHCCEGQCERVAAMDELYNYDYCYECQGYGDDYYMDEYGEWVSACDDCPHNKTWSDDDG